MAYQNQEKETRLDCQRSLDEFSVHAEQNRCCAHFMLVDTTVWAMFLGSM